MIFPAKPAFWLPIAKGATDEHESLMRQSDRSSRDAGSDINNEAEKKGAGKVGDNWEDDDELQLRNREGKQKTTDGDEKLLEELHG